MFFYAIIYLMKALYRRYRPKNLEEVIGQPQITDILKKSLASGKIAHSYLFVGPRGCGKTSVARILAHEINQFPYELEDDYLDIIEIDAASNTGVDNIRDLREKAIIAPAKGKYKIYIIDEVHMLSKSAFNALLKTLEEPPEHVIFIMATTDAHKVPVTITSRSQVFTFKLADPSTMFEHLKKITKAEKIQIADDALKIIVKRGGGSFRDSLSLLDQISTISDSEITAEIVNSALGLPQEDIIQSLLAAYQSGNLDTVRVTLQNLYDSNIKAESIADSLITEIIANPSAALLPLLDQLIEVQRSPYPQVKLLLALASQAKAVRYEPVVTVAPAPQTISVPAPQAAQTPAPQATPAPAPETPKPAPAPTEPPKAEAKSEPAPAPETPKPTAPVIEQIASGTPNPELWQKVLEYAQTNLLSIHKYLVDSDYLVDNSQLVIYAKRKFAKTQLDKKKSALAAILPDSMTIEVKAETLAKDETIADIAAIMGGGEEVQIDA